MHSPSTRKSPPATSSTIPWCRSASDVQQAVSFLCIYIFKSQWPTWLFNRFLRFLKHHMISYGFVSGGQMVLSVPCHDLSVSHWSELRSGRIPVSVNTTGPICPWTLNCVLQNLGDVGQTMIASPNWKRSMSRLTSRFGASKIRAHWSADLLIICVIEWNSFTFNHTHVWLYI